MATSALAHEGDAPGRRAVGALVTVAGALVFRALLFASKLVSTELQTRDSGEYVLLADSLLKQHVFGWDGVPKMNRTPGYPAFLAAIFAIVGRSQLAVVSVQAVLDALTAALVYDLARRFGVSPRGRGVAAVAAATCAFTAVLSFQEMTETLYTFGIILGVWLLPSGGLARFFRWRNGPRVFASGLVIGLTALVRPVEAFALPIFGLVAGCLALWRFGPRRAVSVRVVAMLALYGVGGAVALVPWMARNRIVFASEYEKPHHENVTLMGYTTDVPVYRAWYSREFTFFRRSYEEPMVMENPYDPPVVVRYVYPEEREEVIAAFRALSAEIHASETVPITADTLRAFERIGERRYAAAPRLHLTAPLSRAAKLWIAPRASILFKEQHGGNIPLRTTVMLTVYDAVYVLPGMVGLALGFRRAPVLGAGIVAALAAHTAIYTFWHSAPHSRYCVPLFPFLCVGWGCLVGLAHRRSNGRFRAV